MRIITDISDLYDNEVEVVCANGDVLRGILLLVESNYVILKTKQTHQIIFDAQRISIIGG